MTKSQPVRLSTPQSAPPHDAAMSKASDISPWALVAGGGASFAYLADLVLLALSHRLLLDATG